MFLDFAIFSSIQWRAVPDCFQSNANMHTVLLASVFADIWRFHQFIENEMTPRFCLV